MNAKLLTVREVAELSGLTEQTIRAYRCRGQFPKEAHMIGVTPVWKLRDVQQWMRERRPVGRPVKQ